jgi:uncharacterized protein (DUF2164 family)
VGWLVFQYIKVKIKKKFIFKLVIVGMMLVLGFVGCFAILTTDGSIYITGKFMSFNAPELTIEKTIQNQNQIRETIKMVLDQETKIIIEQVESKFFFDIIISEKYMYSSLSYNELLPATERFNRNNVTVWSLDGKHVDTIIIIKP